MASNVSAPGDSVSAPLAVGRSNALPKTHLSYRWVISDAKILMYFVDGLLLTSPTFTTVLPVKENAEVAWNLLARRYKEKGYFVLELGVRANTESEGIQSKFTWHSGQEYSGSSTNDAHPRFYISECTFSVINPKTNGVMCARGNTHVKCVPLERDKSFICYGRNFDKPKDLMVDGKITVQVEAKLLSFSDPDDKTEDLYKVEVPLDNIRSELYTLFSENVYTDVTIKCEDKEFEAHKAVLASQSPVFKTMFEVDMTEKNSSIIEVSDLDSTVMSDLMAYLYTGKVPNLKTLAKELLNAANKYELPRLFAMCENELIQDLKIDNAVEMLLWADLHSAKNMKTVCVRFIHLNSSDVQTTSGWKYLKDNADTLSSLLVELMEYNN